MKLKSFTTFREAWFLASHPKLWFRKPFLESDCGDDPYALFERWFKDASKSLFSEFPNAFCLGTLDNNGQPESRVVLMKSYDRNGFVFYTNTESSKGRSIAAHNKVSMMFYWQSVQRQVRVEGIAVPVSEAEADSYFAKRPRRSQAGAWASRQSSVLDSRDTLESKVDEVIAEYEGKTIPRPSYWSGYRIIPSAYEFWELRLNRLHDRFRFEREGEKWKRMRLFP